MHQAVNQPDIKTLSSMQISIIPEFSSKGRHQTLSILATQVQSVKIPIKKSQFRNSDLSEES